MARFEKFVNARASRAAAPIDCINSVALHATRHEERRMSGADYGRPGRSAGSSATHIAVMNERPPKMLRKSLFTASMISAGCVVLRVAVMKEQLWPAS